MRRKQRIVLTASGVGVIDAGRREEIWRCEWDQVREVVAWKEDAGVFDVICMGFRTSDEPRYLVAHEEAGGWDDLTAALKYRFGIRQDDWFPRVAFPAFRENWTVLWGKAGGEEQGRNATSIVNL